VCGDDGDGEEVGVGVDDGEAMVFIHRSETGVEYRLNIVTCREKDGREAITFNKDSEVKERAEYSKQEGKEL
jgi:hypothetical protein